MGFVTYEQGKRDQAKLRLAAKNYKPKHSAAWYLKYLKKLGSWDLDDVHPQDADRQGFLFVFFSVPTQHVWGNSLEECLDIAEAGGNDWSHKWLRSQSDAGGGK